MDTETLLSRIDRVALRAAVRRTVCRDTAEVVDYQARSIHVAFNQVTGGLFRLSGSAQDHGKALPWSIIVKVARNVADVSGTKQVDPAQPNYWKREPLLYRSGLLERLPPGIVAPRCYGVTEPAPDTAWIWLEDVVETSGPRWSVDRYGLAARHVGAFNGAYLAGLPRPSDSCLTRGWLSAAVVGMLSFHDRMVDARAHPLALGHGWSSALFDRMERLVAEKDLFFAALARLPQTFCHMDVFRGNLLARRGPDDGAETVAVDWSFSGHGVVGQDLYPMIAGSVLFYHAEREQMAELDAAVFAGYVDGLRDAGWMGDPRLARLGCTVASALRWGTAPHWLMVLDDEFAAAVQRSTGHSIEESLERSALLANFVLDQADEARDLMQALSGRSWT